MYGLSTNDVSLLKQSAPMVANIAKEGCAKKDSGGMEEWAKTNKELEDEISCEWYHSTWQYLRLLNMVAVPNWYEFYVDAISKVLKSKKNPKVFISACADYGMLAKLHEAFTVAQVVPEIIIYDICNTPLQSCKWYAEKFNINIVCKSSNIIFDDIPEAPFDLIITDEFLTVLKDPDKPTIVNRWYELLAEGGAIVTTAMIGEITTQERRDYFYEKAKRTFTENKAMMFPFVTTKEQEDDILNKFKVFAQLHTRHMLQNKELIPDLFSKFSSLNYTEIVTPGECVNPTNSLQIVAIK